MNLAVADADKSANSASVDIEGVSLSYGTTRVLKGIDLSIKPGELFSFLGPSGCGKTTLLRLIAGFNHANEGRISIAGVDVGNLPPWHRDVGLVFQSYALWPHMTVARNVAFGLEERRIPRADIAPRVDAALNLVGLAQLANRRPSELSGGQQQRVALARTLVIRPKVLLLDEPLSNLDARLRVDVRRELRDLQSSLGITTIFVTHDQEEANTISDRIAVMNDGVVQQVGTPMELYDRPANLFVAGFLGTANVIAGKFVSNGATRAYEITNGLRVPVVETGPIDTEAKLVVRPQSIALTKTTPNGTDGFGLVGTVANREFLGASIRYEVRVGANEILVDVPFGPDTAIWETGAPVSLKIADGAARWVSA